ncbi:MAG: hypothetical protein KME69_13130 [Candidatus Thiodiazotropha sp. (ex Codakia orbicularis)]|nr:hypothetical protein [Candidatus Thiodiazotropha sp. (ex Codakia orbicularis)]
MKTISELINIALSDQKLNILLFGPNPSPPSTDERIRKFQLKRDEIRQALELEHVVNYGEEVVNPSLPPPYDNLFLQEIFLLQEYDLVINLISGSGTVVETTMIAMKPDIAKKSHLFLDENHIDSFVGQACKAAQVIGAEFSTFIYPTDIDDCNLLGMVREKVRALQYAKFLS